MELKVLKPYPAVLQLSNRGSKGPLWPLSGVRGIHAHLLPPRSRSLRGGERTKAIPVEHPFPGF